MQHRIKCAMAGCLAGLTLTVAAAPQAGAVTIGQVAPESAPTPYCMGLFDVFNSTVSKGESYVVPSYGTAITSWSTKAAGGLGQQLTLKVFRLVSGDTFEVVALDGPRDLMPGTLNTFRVNIGVLPGDLIGLNSANASPGVPNACVFTDPAFTSPTDRYRSHIGDHPVGSSDTYYPIGSVAHTNVSAVVKPINTFTLGALAKNKKKGTATLSVDIPLPGELALSGRGVKGAVAAGTRLREAVSGPGTAILAIKAQGKTRKKLRATGKATVNATVTYTPTDGDPNAQTRKVKLRKKL